jgi:hypothetical protein
MPDFFYRQFPKLRLKLPLMEVSKPIVYAYTKTPGLEADVKVAFTDGAPVVWWPCCTAPLQPDPRDKPQLYRELHWRTWIGNKVPATYRDDVTSDAPAWREPTPPALPANSWLNQARLDGPATFSVRGTPVRPQRKWQQEAVESERFIFYDGLLPAPDFVRCLKVEGGVTLQNSAAFALPELFVVDRRSTVKDGKVRWAYLPKLAPGAQVAVTFGDTAVKDWPEAARRAAEQSLIEAGLYAPEAKSLLAIWNERFFHADGITAFHLLPAAEYDRRLPLQVSPRPGRIVRVGVILYPRLDVVPEIARRAAQLIAQLDNANFQVRDQATRELIAIGPHAFPHLRRALADRPPLEVRLRIERILEEAHDATGYLPAR